jgi:hypothetical protein
MTTVSLEFAEILGLLCAEGHHSVLFQSYWGKDRGRARYYKNHKSEHIEFFNKDVKLLNRLQKLLKIEFNYSSKITKHNKINICKRSTIREITKQTPLGHLKWKVPESIISSST